MKKNFLLSLLMVTTFLGSQLKAAAQSNEEVFAELIRQYEQSINDADTVLAAKIWSQTQEVSFIHPRATEYGWTGVKNVYKMFQDNFTKRSLYGANAKVTVYGDVAWLTFTWVFDAVFKDSNQPIQTKGRETQLWRKTGSQWRLVHVHYSGMPVTGKGQGF